MVVIGPAESLSFISPRGMDQFPMSDVGDETVGTRNAACPKIGAALWKEQPQLPMRLGRMGMVNLGLSGILELKRILTSMFRTMTIFRNLMKL
jgi:hypothetical protein